MKKTNLLLVCLAIALSSALFFACKKENNVEIKSNTIDESRFFKNVSFNDGMLIFREESSIEVLCQSMLYDRTKAEDILKAQFPSFRSNNTAYNEFMSKLDLDRLDEKTVNENSNLICLVPEGDDKKLRKTLDSHFLSCIANENGFFQVGNIIFKITADVVYQYDAISKAEIKKDLIVRTIQDVTRDSEIRELKYNCSGSKKIRVCIFTKGYTVYSEAGCNAENTRKGTFGWVSSSVPNINISGTFTVNRFQITSPGTMCSSTPFTCNKSFSNDSFVEFVGTSCWTCCNSITVPACNVTAAATTNGCGIQSVNLTF